MKQQFAAKHPWAILAAGAAIQILTGLPAAWGVFQQPVMDEFSLTEDGAGYAFGAAVHDLKKQGCDMAVLGCTELSLVKRDEHLGKFFIDSTEVLCRHALEACGVKPIGF